MSTAGPALGTPGRQLALDFPLRADYGFHNFVVAERNREALSALRRLQAAGEGFYYLWGRPGVGKSHLLQAVCGEAEAAAYLPLRRFRRHAPTLLDGLDNLPLVCLDDIDLVLGHAGWEEELFALFNALRERGHLLVVSAAQPPAALPARLPDLASRLSWGVTYHLHELDDTGKAQVLLGRARERGFELGEDCLAYILQRSGRGLTSLLEVLDTLDRLSLSEQRRITIPFIRRILGTETGS